MVEQEDMLLAVAGSRGQEQLLLAGDVWEEAAYECGVGVAPAVARHRSSADGALPERRRTWRTRRSLGRLQRGTGLRGDGGWE